ncbi:MAG: DUF2461 domain-containing protein [Bacteroidia bacterium]
MKKANDFLKKLKKNNNKEWFDKNRTVYEEAKAEFSEIVQDVLNRVAKFDKSMAGMEAKKTLFRINRDIRFSKNKDPYKTNFGSNMSPGGKKSLLAGYYLHMEPGKCFLAGGCYMPEPAQLAAIRQEIDYDFKNFKKILEQKDFKKYFGGLSDEEKLVNPPKGYDKENPAVEYIKYKHFIAYHEVPDKIVMSPKFPQYAADVFKAMYPFIVFLRNVG